MKNFKLLIALIFFSNLVIIQNLFSQIVKNLSPDIVTSVMDYGCSDFGTEPYPSYMSQSVGYQIIPLTMGSRHERFRMIAWWQHPHFTLPSKACNIKVTLCISHSTAPANSKIRIIQVSSDLDRSASYDLSTLFPLIDGSDIGYITNNSGTNNIDKFDVTAKFLSGERLVYAARETSDQGDNIVFDFLDRS